MSARPKSNLPADFRNEMSRLHYAGFHLLPLGGGDDGKKPLLSGWANKQPTLGQVFGPMHRSGVEMYGIRLDGLAVVDCDIDDPDLVASLEARFGPSPVHVKTPRGQHLYYRVDDIEKLPNLRGEGLLVDIKTGPRAYVVGPFSRRPDGGSYALLTGNLGVDALPCLKLPHRSADAPTPPSASIPIGARHSELVKHAVKRVANASDPEELVADLRRLRDGWCETPKTMPETELSAIARWAWTCRLENRLFAGRNSAFPVPRKVLDYLRGKPGQEDALALYVLLCDQHGHNPGKAFPICWKAMKDAGLVTMSQARLRAARRSLEKGGFLKLARAHKAGVRMQSFVLAMPVCISDPDRVKALSL